MAMRPHADRTGRWLGLAVFLLGIVFLVIVFVLAYQDLAGTGVIGRLAAPSPSVVADAALRTLVIKGVLFFVMAYVGSAVAGRGIGLYAAAGAGEEPS